MTWESKAKPQSAHWLKDMVYCRDNLVLYAEELLETTGHLGTSAAVLANQGTD